MPEASRLLATACASKRVWLMPSARTDEPHERSSIIIDSKTNVTICSVAMSSFGPRPLRWEASYWPTGFG
jgi:hypothetical protein